MESVEVSAKTVDEAIDIALDELGLIRSQVDIEVLTPGKPGLFGLGGEQARVRVVALEDSGVAPAESPEEDYDEAPRPQRDEPEVRPTSDTDIVPLDAEEVVAATEFLEDVLELAGVAAVVTVREPETAADGLGRASAVLDIEGEDLGLLIGRRGSTIAALQYIVNVMITRRQGNRVLVTVDAEHYHRRREDTLRALARRMADRVHNSRRSLTLEPMPAAERRIIHLELSDDDDVETGSVGMGDERKIVIRPARGERR
jgi:spoIIIJ-associated protein